MLNYDGYSVLPVKYCKSPLIGPCRWSSLKKQVQLQANWAPFRIWSTPVADPKSATAFTDLSNVGCWLHSLKIRTGRSCAWLAENAKRALCLIFIVSLANNPQIWYIFLLWRLFQTFIQKDFHTKLWVNMLWIITIIHRLQITATLCSLYNWAKILLCHFLPMYQIQSTQQASTAPSVAT